MPRSFSQLQVYRTCPRQYEFGYVKKLPRGGISAGESFGTSMHNALKKWGELEVGKLVMGNKENQLQLFTDEKPTNYPLPITLDTLIDFWKQSFVVEGYASLVEADHALQKGEGIIKLYYDYWQQADHHVLQVETGFKVQIGDTHLSGRFDRVEQVEGGVKVIDYKTSAVRSQTETDADLQLSVYAMACQEAFGQPCKELSFLFLREDGITEVVTTRNTSQLEDAKKQIQSIDSFILEEEFRPTPGKVVCSRCPYKNVCDSAAC